MRHRQAAYRNAFDQIAPVRTDVLHSRVPEKEVIESSLTGKPDFTTLFKSYDDLMLSIDAYKSDEALCCKIIQFLTTHKQEFALLFKIHFEITYIAQRVSKTLGDHLIHYVVNNQDEFNRLVQTDDDLQILSTTFPRYACIFSQPSIKQAQEALADVQAIKTIFNLLLIESDDENSSLHGVMSNELLLKIAVFAQDHPLLTHDDAYRLASTRKLNN